MKQFIIFIALLFSATLGNAQTANTIQLAKKVLQKGLNEVDLGAYQGSLLLQGMAELAMVSNDDNMQRELLAIYKKFNNGEIEGKGSFISYKAGGNGAAYLKYKKITSVLDAQLLEASAQMFEKQKRSKEGLLTANWASDKTDQVFIDMAFAVTPFMLYTGLAQNREDYVNISVSETLGLFKILNDSKTNLLHQGRGFNGLGSISEDNWSRGNGWGALALATLIRDLPVNHPKRKEVEALAKEFFMAVINHQDKDGLWHQEMTDQSSFIETSGSGLLLYSLGIVIEKGLLDKKYLSNFKNGITALASYVADDGGVSHACFSCLCPRKGTKEDYVNHVWIYNDPHGFGPLVLAFAEANKIGIKELQNPNLGKYAVLDTISQIVKTYVKYVPERSEDIAWENDRIAFRYYGPPVRDKVSSGVDIFAKSVSYSILDKWYRLNGRGLDYHVDRGEGMDFYHAGFLRGCGGTAIWKDGKPYPSPTYDSHHIINNDKNRIDFELNFDTWDAGDIKVSEQKTISMVNGTNFFKVTSIIKSDSKKDIILGIGLTTFGHPSIIQNKEKALLASWEKIEEAKVNLGTVVVVNPAQFVNYAQYNADQYILIKVKPNQTFTYYVGAGWDGNPMFKQTNDWNNYISKEGNWIKLNKLYKVK